MYRLNAILYIICNIFFKFRRDCIKHTYEEYKKCSFDSKSVAKQLDNYCCSQMIDHNTISCQHIFNNVLKGWAYQKRIIRRSTTALRTVVFCAFDFNMFIGMKDSLYFDTKTCDFTYDNACIVNNLYCVEQQNKMRIKILKKSKNSLQ